MSLKAVTAIKPFAEEPVVIPSDETVHVHCKIRSDGGNTTYNLDLHLDPEGAVLLAIDMLRAARKVQGKIPMPMDFIERYTLG